ncbi:hypothetical protein NE865_09882 [Phthorimaea operculella]|nr:hypothetical protein NE865_09882 [Phthorimaea operculella]
MRNNIPTPQQLFISVFSIFGMPCVSKKIGSEWNAVWDALLEKDVSPSTYYSLQNISLGPNLDYKFDYSAIEHLYRRYTVYMDQRPWNYTHDKTYRQEAPDRFTMFLCRAGNAMYLAAGRDLSNFIPIRLLYQDNLEFEIGYLVYQVIHRYQMMVELYEVAHRRFYLHQWQMRGHHKYMLHIYRTMLKLCNVIIHFCNLAQVVEKEYEGHDSIFVHTEPPEPSGSDPSDPNNQKEVGMKRKKTTVAVQKFEPGGNINKKMHDMEKQRKKALKKERKRQMLEGMVKYTPKSEPKRPPRYQYIYGWSIEDWWL